MRRVKSLQPLEVVVTEVVDRHHVALTRRVDALHPPKVHLVAVNVPIHGLDEDVDTMEIVVERPVTEVLLGAEDHHLTGLIVVAEAQVVVIDGVPLRTWHRVLQIEAHGRIVGDQEFVHRHQEAGGLHPHDFPTLLTKMEDGLVVDATKHIDLVAHHTDAALKVDIAHQVLDLIVTTIRLHPREHGLLVRRVHQHLVLIAAQDVLIEMLALMEDDRVDGIFRAVEIEAIKVGQGDKDLVGRDVETRPVGATAHALPMVVIQIVDAFGILE